ncbi:MAG: hypothetical protein ACRDVP_04775 [Acidimicrobiales bacterium]
MPASSVASLTHDTFRPEPSRHYCVNFGTRISFSYTMPAPRTVPQLIVGILRNRKTVSYIGEFLDPKARLSNRTNPFHTPVRRHFIEVDGTPAVWVLTYLDGITMYAEMQATVLQITVAALPNKYVVAHRMMSIALNKMSQASRTG